MIKDLRIRFVIIFIVIAVALFYCAPTFFKGKLPEFWTTSKYLPNKTLNLGLDLKGGMHLLLGVNLDEALASSLNRIGVELKSFMDEEAIPYESVALLGNDALKVVLTEVGGEDKLKAHLKESYNFLEVKSSNTVEGKAEIVLAYGEKDLVAFKEHTVEQTLETIRNRVDQLGLTEPEITRQGDYDILIQLPGLQDPEKAKEIIRKVALLEFKLVDEQYNVEEALKGNIPEGDEILYEKVRDRETGEIVEERPYLVESNTLMTGEVIADASIAYDRQAGNRPIVQIRFDKRGGVLFEKISGDNVGRYLAIILDDVVYSAPVIKTKISGGEAVIEGNFSIEDAKELVIVLRAGALPATISVLEERTVGPSLGSASIRSGVIATLIGLAAVVLFIALYYGVSGLVADSVLILNFIIILGVMSLFQATLTLPGIAGIALTLGMAVDANVLIYERVREELRLGKTPRAALDAGYAKAFLTIMDSNITTLIAALVLFQFGTGPVKGFAVTLSVGIMTSLFTAVFVSHAIFDLFMSRFRIKKLSV